MAFDDAFGRIARDMVAWTMQSCCKRVPQYLFEAF